MSKIFSAIVIFCSSMVINYLFADNIAAMVSCYGTVIMLMVADLYIVLSLPKKDPWDE